MEFLNPAALYGLLALPLLFIPYLIKGRPRRIVFSSLLLLHDLASRTSSRTWGRLRLPPIFFLQLLLLVLLILALGEPVFSVRPSRIAIVVDNSASMQALEGKTSRFALALDEARALLRDLAATARVDLYLTVPRLEKIGAEPQSPAAASKVLAALKPYDLGDPPGDFGNKLSRLTREQSYDRLFFIGDHPARGGAAAVRVISVGQPKGNLAISSLRVTRSSLAAAQLEAGVEIANLSSADATVKVALKGGGKKLSSRTLTVRAGMTESINFSEVPLRSTYEAEIEPGDALPLDDRRFAVAPAARNLRILGISPRPESLASLRSIPGVSLEIISPAAYEKTQRADHELEIFHFSAPASLPRSHALFILPPNQNPLVGLKNPVSNPAISGWKEPHPLTRYVNFALFRPRYARPLKPGALGDAVIESPEGALAVAVEHRGRRYLVLGFDLLPYLGKENLPVSIFTLNALDWFAHAAGPASQATGDLLRLSIPPEGASLTNPLGEKFNFKPGSTLFPATWFQGIYEANRGTGKESFAVNLEDAQESDLRNPAPIDLRDEGEAKSSPSALFSVWPYLLLLSLLLLVLEWFLNPPLTRSELRWRARGAARGS